MSDPKLAEEIARAVGGQGAGTVKLAGYIRDNFALITEQKKRATWAQVAAAIAARGVRDANGEEPNLGTVREAYRRIARQIAKDRQGRVGRPLRPEGLAQPRHSSKRFEE